MEIFKVKAPFKKVKDNFIRDDNFTYWVFGMVFDVEGDGYGMPDYDVWAHGEGMAEYQLIATIKLNKPFKDRVLYRMRITDPEGISGKFGEIKVCTKDTFEKLKKGYKWHYYVDATREPVVS